MGRFIRHLVFFTVLFETLDEVRLSALVAGMTVVMAVIAFAHFLLDPRADFA
jgi:hypothetical protein